MAKPPAIDEREFLRVTQNHGEFGRKLQSLSFAAASIEVVEQAHHVGLCWLRLAADHLADARAAEASGRQRAAYSRSYYAAYSASKSVRYIVSGAVSLKGDDHKKASELPDDFPEVEKWSGLVTTLYEHRLRADYDNWAATNAEHHLTTTQCVELASQLVTEATKYLSAKYGIAP
jgi:HEPN domain